MCPNGCGEKATKKDASIHGLMIAVDVEGGDEYTNSVHPLCGRFMFAYQTLLLLRIIHQCIVGILVAVQQFTGR